MNFKEAMELLKNNSKKAKEMFEEIGYLCSIENNEIIVYEKTFEYAKVEITFNKLFKQMECEANKDIRFTFDENELKAINQQCKELGLLK